MGLTAGNGLWAIDRPKANLSANAYALAANLIIVACLMKPLGVFGAALAILGGNVVGAALRYRTLRRLLKIVQPSVETP